MKEKDVILLHPSSGSTTYKEAWRGESICTKHGVISREDVERGGYVKTHKGETYLVLNKPSLRDRIQHMRKGARPIYEYDAGVICALLSLERGHTVIEAGTGSACLTLYMASIVAPEGKIYTFEKEERFYEIAKENVEKSGLEANIVLKHGDVLKENVDVLEADAIMLDMEDALKAVEKLNPNLKAGGYLGMFTPVEKDLEEAIKHLKSAGFMEITAIQFNLRDMMRRNELFGFPGYFVVGRKA